MADAERHLPPPGEPAIAALKRRTATTTPVRHAHPWVSRTLLIATALLSSAAALWIGGHHPLGALPAITIFALTALVSYARLRSGMFLLPALLPVLGFAPWTGWLVFEEMDLAILGVAAGAYARFATAPLPAGDSGRSASSLTLTFLLSLLTISTAISLFRGFADAGGFRFDWFGGYDSPLNSLRIAKGFVLALLLLPWVQRVLATDGEQATRLLSRGLACGLGLAALAALWERLAFTDLLDFSSDYRTTALFWEMHVGGAALDGFLAMTFPFAVWGLRSARTPLRWGLFAGLLALAAYACLTTFSRGVYLAVPAALAVLTWRLNADTSRKPVADNHSWSGLGWTVAAGLCAAGGLFVFPTSGYRGLLALLGLIVLLLPLGRLGRELAIRQRIAALGAGFVAGIALIPVAVAIPKGPYVIYGLLILAGLVSLFAGHRLARPGRARMLALATFSAALIGATHVAYHWGGAVALPGYLPVIAVITALLAWSWRTRRPLWPESLRWQGTMLLIAASVSATVAVFSGGAYIGSRFATGVADFEGRLRHWQLGLAMLNGPLDLVFGKGLGRFPANYFFSAPENAFPGTYRVSDEDGDDYLSLTGGRHILGDGEILRITQRLPAAPGPSFVISFRARANMRAALHVSVCEKHLLYSYPCRERTFAIEPAAGGWASYQASVDGRSITGGPWYVPRPISFSVGVGTSGARIDVDDLVLMGADGRNQLVNNDFSQGMSRWFFTSDHHHLPWHAKNIFLNILFDQGGVGLALFALLTTAAFWRLSLGRSRDHELAPALAAGLTGFLIVGLFDSLLDVPRLVFLYYFLIIVAFLLRPRPLPLRAGTGA